MSHFSYVSNIEAAILFAAQDIQVVDPVKLADFCAKCQNTQKRFGYFAHLLGHLTCTLTPRQAQTSLTKLEKEIRFLFVGGMVAEATSRLT